MRNTKSHALLSMLVGVTAAGTANAGEVLIGNPNAGAQAADYISTSTTWTANNTYNLQDQIWVLPGATLTIEAGTVIATETHLDHLGSLAVCRDAQIFVNGTLANPVIFTSENDVATWDVLPAHPTGHDPKSGNWRVAANEWGNLTIMGKAFVSKSTLPGNSATCNANNLAPMEGLIPASGHETEALYGGNQDNDDSGNIHYLSLRYGGKVIAVTNELNGLSLGGVGRNTEIHHVDIMNNVDDGVEIWGGTVNLKYVNIWNIGDDSFDLDQGWRGKAQFGLIVQGYSLNAAQGGGVGDNAFETDGAEDSFAQPVTTAAVYNFTVVGQPGGNGGDHGTAWRDNARIQYRNCIFMDLGERLVSFDNVDGDGGSGYGAGVPATLTWPNTWTTAYTYSHGAGTPNACANPEDRYEAQSAGDSSIGQGFLAEITDSVFFRNQHASAYTESDARGVTVGGGSNPAKGNVVAPNMPIAVLVRGPAVNPSGSLNISPVISIDPRAVTGSAINSVSSAPNDGFFTSAAYRGAFSNTENWLCGWTAADAFGFNTCATTTCAGNIINTGTSVNKVDVDDLLAVISSWGACPAPPAACPANVVNTGTSVNKVDVDDLLFIISNWGPCV